MWSSDIEEHLGNDFEGDIALGVGLLKEKNKVTNKSKLKPCPWPGKSKPKICKSPKFPSGYNWQVIWRDSGVQIMTCAFPTRREAIDAWNKRS